MNISFYLAKANKVIADPTPPANATLTFTESGTGLTFDDLGNPVVSDSSLVTLTCWLKQGRPPENQTQPGSNLNENYYYGELISPKTYPLPFKTNGAISVSLNGRTGSFVPVDFPDTPAGYGWEINQYHGQRIAGWIQFLEGN